MKVKNFTGFMLGNEGCVHQIGSQWLNYDAHIWVCPNLSKAKKVLQESQKRMNLEPHAIWTTIYQVSGRDMVFEQGKDGLLYTDAPTKLFVERVALRQPVQTLDEEFLLQNAKQQSVFFDVIRGRKK